MQATPIEIFVERGVAKVNVTTATNLKNDVEIDGTTYQATVIGWSLDITNKWSYMVRNIDGFDTWKDYTAAVKVCVSTAPHPTASIGLSTPTMMTPWRATMCMWQIISTKSQLLRTEALTTPHTFWKIHSVLPTRGEPVRPAPSSRLRSLPKVAEAADFYQVGSSNTIYDKEGMRNVVIAQAVNVIEGKTTVVNILSPRTPQCRHRRRTSTYGRRRAVRRRRTL